jgi:hypothetical protein
MFGNVEGCVERGLQKREVDPSWISSLMSIDCDLEGLKELIGLYPWLLDDIQRPPV